MFETDTVENRKDAPTARKDNPELKPLLPNEVRVYLAIEDLGSDATSENVSKWLEKRRLGIPRTTIHDTAVSLQARKLISTRKDHKSMNVYKSNKIGRESVREFLQGQIALITALESYDGFFKEWRKEAFETIQRLEMQLAKVTGDYNSLNALYITSEENLQKATEERDKANKERDEATKERDELRAAADRHLFFRFLSGFWEFLWGKPKKKKI